MGWVEGHLLSLGKGDTGVRAGGGRRPFHRVPAPADHLEPGICRMEEGAWDEQPARRGAGSGPGSHSPISTSHLPLACVTS